MPPRGPRGFCNAVRMRWRSAVRWPALPWRRGCSGSMPTALRTRSGSPSAWRAARLKPTVPEARSSVFSQDGLLSAIQAACLAKAGVDGPAQAFEGRYGFYRCFLDGAFDPAVLAGGLGEHWEVGSLRFKPYPSNYYTHAGIDAALALSRRGLKPEQVQSAELAVATPMLRTMGEPLVRKRAPRSAYEAKFSGPYTVASALIGGTGLGLGIDDFTDLLVREPRRVALMQRITVVADPRCDAVFPDQAPAVLTVVTRGGDQLLEAVMVNRGGPDKPLEEGELVAKFDDCVERGLPPHIVRSLRTAIEDLPSGSAARLAQLFKLI